ncbi:MAG: T9SS type A sorting domain-containing protein [Bacteroidetes bacterium]|nr:T9SS type A sorting domain-containing protein [Bacteroidota bacterium]
MKKFILLIFIFLLSLSGQNSFSQIPNWSPLKRLTSGYKDTNPDFSSPHYYSFYSYPFWEFMVFQRKIDTASQICVLRFNKDSAIDAPKYLTSNNFLKKNPCIASKQIVWNDTIRYSLALWESNQNGKWDIYASYYSPTGWSSPFPLDSGTGNKFNPKAIQISETEFGIVYTKDDDIIYRRYNAQTRTILSESNLTSSIATQCSNCLIAVTSSTGLRVNFRSKKADNNFCIYKATSGNNGDTWTLPDTLAFTGNNLNIQLAKTYSTQQIFESDRSGKNAIYCYNTNFGNNLETVIISSYFNYYGLKTWFFPIITESISSDISAVVRKSSDSTKILFNFASSSTYGRDSITVGDTSKNVKIALNNGIRFENKYALFAVFNIDTAGYTSLYFKYRYYVLNGIINTSTFPAKDFALSQNYPNPFNPTTKVKFDIPKLSDVNITIFDAVGREVKNISQNNLSAGSYEYVFSGENLSSGIYYFKLQAGEFSKTVKMLLVK